MPITPRLTRLVLALGMAATVAAQQVHVVDDAGGPGVFVTVQAAIDAAASGDTVLIAGGSYGNANIVAKSLMLVGDVGASVSLARVRISNLPAGGEVVVRNVAVQGSGPALEATDCAGTIWLEDGAFRGPLMPLVAGDPGHGVLISNVAALVVERSIISGGGPLSTNGAQGHTGLILVDTTAVIAASSITGGWGLTGSSIASHGGTGLSAADSEVHLQGSSVVGGIGGAAFETILICYPAGDGGAGIASGPGSLVEVLDTSTAGGLGGAGTANCPVGQVGAGTVSLGGRVDHLPGVAPTVTAPSPVRGGETLVFTIAGTTGDPTWLLVSIAPDLLPVPGWRGPLVPALAGGIFVPLGALPSSAAGIAVVVPVLVGLDTVSLRAQAVSYDGQGFLAGSAQVVNVLAPGF